MRFIAFLSLSILGVLFFAFTQWMQRVQLPRLIAERRMLGIKAGQTYWSWPWQRKLESLISQSAKGKP